MHNPFEENALHFLNTYVTEFEIYPSYCLEYVCYY